MRSRIKQRKRRSVIQQFQQCLLWSMKPSNSRNKDIVFRKYSHGLTVQYQSINTKGETATAYLNRYYQKPDEGIVRVMLDANGCKGLPFISTIETQEEVQKYYSGELSSIRKWFVDGLADAEPDLIDKATIPVEKIKAPIFLASDTDDRTWPSSEFCEAIVQRLEAHHFPYEYKHIRGEKAGHLVYYPVVKMNDHYASCNKNVAVFVLMLSMRPIKLKIIITLCFMASFIHLASPALAHSRQHPFSLSITGGFLSRTTLGKFNPLPNTADVPEIMVSLENIGTSFGLSLGYEISDRFELLGTFTYGRSEIINNVGIGLAGIPLGKTKVSNANNLTYSGNVLVNFPLNRISPYLTAGLGAITLKPDKLRSSTKLLVIFGAGVKLSFNRYLSAFIDLKDHVIFFNYLKDFDVLYAAIYTPDLKKSQHRIGIRFGLSYTF